MQSLNNIESNIQRLEEQLRSLREREGYLQTQLSGLPRNEEKQDKKRLEELKVHLMYLQSRFSNQYPDVIKTKTEIDKLENQRGELNDKNVKSSFHDIPPDNPAYITLAAQLSSTQADIESVNRQINDASKIAHMYRERIANTPKVEEGYKSILIERNNTQAKYDDLMKKHLEAKVAQGLEKEQKGERFTLVDPPRYPEKPYKPNRLGIVMVGVILSFGASIGWASIREFTDDSIRDSYTLSMTTSFPVIGAIPNLLTLKDVKRMKRKNIFAVSFSALFLTSCILYFHFNIMTLGEFWEKLMKKLML